MTYYEYDVFLSHSSKDKAVVRPLAERLRADGVRVWFDEWGIAPGDSIPSKIEEGLQEARILVLCMSQNAFGSDWAGLESQTFRFRDPLNRERRFIPLRLDDAPAPGSLAQFMYVDWRTRPGEEEYAKLLRQCHQPKPESISAATDSGALTAKVLSFGHVGIIACVAVSPDGNQVLSGSYDKTLHVWDATSGRHERALEGHSASILSVAWSPRGSQVLSGSHDNTLRVWDLKKGRCERVLEGHSDSVFGVAWSPDGRCVLSGSRDNTLRVWDPKKGRCEKVLEGHTDSVLSVAWGPDGRRALSGSRDNTLRVWDMTGLRCERVLAGHTDSVLSVAWSPDGRWALSASYDNTVRLWEVSSGRCERVLGGHSDHVSSVAWSADGGQALSASYDNTIRVWNLASRRCVRVLRGHTDHVLSVAWSADARHAFSGSDDTTVRVWEMSSGRCERVLGGQSHGVLSVAWSADGRRALSGCDDTRVRVWDVNSGHCERMLEGHLHDVLSVAWSADGRRALSGSRDKTARVWDVSSGRCEYVLRGHLHGVSSVAWSADGRRALSGSDDCTVRVWDVASGRCERVLEGHSGGVLSVAWSPDGARVLSGSEDKIVRVWDVVNGRCERALEGHLGRIQSVAWSPDGRRVLSGSEDKIVRVWDVASGRCERVLEGHSRGIVSVLWSADGRQALSGSDDSIVRVWDVASGRCERMPKGHSADVSRIAWSPDERYALSGALNGVMRVWTLEEGAAPRLPEGGGDRTPPEREAQVLYTNAKVLLVGDSGAGKTGLSVRLVWDRWEPSPGSTVGAWATRWKLPLASDSGLEREIWLWDFGGQADQRLIHQLYMAETALAVLVVDGQRSDLFETLDQWDRDLTRASTARFTKLLVAGRVDAGGLRVSREQVEQFRAERGYAGRVFETSARTGADCAALKAAILDGIDWRALPWRSSPLVFKQLRDAIVALKDERRALVRFNELRDALRLRLAPAKVTFSDTELEAVIGLLAGPGVVWELGFGSWVLLRPELLNAYAQAAIQTLREDPHERGCLAEERVLSGQLSYHGSVERVDPEEERILLHAMHQTLVARGLCLREHTERGALLIFPSYYRRERPEPAGHPAVFVSYQLSGFLDAIYATLVVRLHHTPSFEQDQLWRYAADFKTVTGQRLGIKLIRRAEGSGELELYCDTGISTGEKIVFARYVHEHLHEKARDVRRFRCYICPHCGTPVGGSQVAMRRVETWLAGPTGPASDYGRHRAVGSSAAPTVVCQECEQRIPLWDEIEERFASDETRERVHALQETAARALDCESKERVLIGEVISTVALSGQIARENPVSDHGIDMELELKDDAGEATGKKLYLLLESSDSHLRKRERDTREVFRIEDDRHARYWAKQAFPVLLVIRDAEGVVRWMEVGALLRRAIDEQGAVPGHIAFDGERLDVMSVRRFRQRVLGGGTLA